MVDLEKTTENRRVSAVFGGFHRKTIRYHETNQNFSREINGNWVFSASNSKKFACQLQKYLELIHLRSNGWHHIHQDTFYEIVLNICWYLCSMQYFEQWTSCRTKRENFSLSICHFTVSSSVVSTYHIRIFFNRN